MRHQSYFTERNEDSLLHTTALENDQAAAEPAAANDPAVPLPNPGEGGAVDPGFTVPSNGSGTPAIPLPNPGEGGAVDSGYPSFGTGSNLPVIPLPNPGEGGAVDSGSSSGSSNRPPIFRPIIGGGSGSNITIIPGITFPCFSCNNTSSNGKVRFFNTAVGYPSFYVYLGNWLVASNLGNGSITGYLQATSGTQTVTVTGTNGYVYIQKQIRVTASSSMTVAIINTSSGLDLMEISDISCSYPAAYSCLRVCSLSLNQSPFNVSVVSQSITETPFTNVRYREVTPYDSFYPGWYQLYVAQTGQLSGVLVSASATLSANASYTLYIYNAADNLNGVRALLVSN